MYVCVWCIHTCVCVCLHTCTHFLHTRTYIWCPLALHCCFTSCICAMCPSPIMFAVFVSSQLLTFYRVLPLSVSIRHCLASLSLDMEVAIAYWAWYESVHGFRLFFSVWIMSLYHHFTQLGYLRGWSLTCWVLLCVISSAAACPLSCFSIAAAGVCAYVMLVWIRNDDLCMQHESVCAGLCSAIEAHPAHLSHTVLYTQSVSLHPLCVHITDRTVGMGYLGKAPWS